MGVMEAIGESRWGARLAHHFPPGQFARYLTVGVANTLFGYATYAGFTALLTPHLPYAYVWASLISGLLNITFGFFNYKWFVFRTKGNYLREWSRCVVVYGGALLVATALLPVTVYMLRHLTAADKSAPYLAGAIMIGISIITSFLGHKNFSFAPPREAAEP